MREIKFRAWDSRYNCMYNWNELALEEKQVFISDGDLYRRYDDELYLMQFTGLKDKNGKEIYEGDILLVEDTFTETVDVGIGSVPVAQTPDNHLCEVVFKSGAFKFVVKEQGEVWRKGEYTLDHEDINGEFEIIGNLYSNPELL